MHRYGDAITQCEKAFEIDPSFPPAHRQLAQVYFLKGMYEQATDELQKAGQVSEKDATDLNEAYRKSGERGFWQMRLELSEKDARAKNREIDSFDLAYFQLGAGNKEQALDSLEKAVANGRGHSEAIRLKAEPKWDPLRAEPRFKELLRKVGRPE